MRAKPQTRFFHIWSGPTPDQLFGVCIHETADFTPGSVPRVAGYRYRGTVRERPSWRQVIENVNPWECRLPGIFRADLHSAN